MTEFYLQVNQKAAESLADPEEYPNLFEDWQIALNVENKVSETRCHILIFMFVSSLLFLCVVRTLYYFVYLLKIIWMIALFES